MKLRKKYTKKNKRTRKKRGGQPKNFDEYKKKAQKLLENIEPKSEHKKLGGIILEKLKTLNVKNFDKFISIINKNIKDIRCMCKFKQKGGAPTTRSSTDPLLRCNICFDELQINRNLPENAEQCNKPQCDKWFHTDCINTLIQTRIGQGNINTFNCPFNCGGTFNRNIQEFDQFEQEDDINNIDEWIQHLQQQQQQEELRDNIDQITSVIFTCLIIVSILIQFRGVYNQGRFGMINCVIFFTYLLPGLTFGMQPYTVVAVRNFILRIIAWIERMTNEEFLEIVREMGAMGGGKRRKKTRKYKGNKYPYKNITKKEAIADFIKLKSTTNPCSLNGLEIVNYGTEKLRVRTKYRGKSLIERWRDKKTRKTLKKFANRLYKGPYTNNLLHAYRSAIALSWGTLSSMRTAAALQMYKKYNAKKVLDFTAGWGSRMTAALAADIDYIGIDSNKSLKKGYNNIIKTVKKHTKSKVKLFFQPAETVNYSKLDYDFVFTSPPYEYLELYEHMKNYEGTKKIKQAHSANDKRRRNDGFYDTFLIPTIKEIYKHLPKGKWMCLNVPDLMYDKIKKKWKACTKKEDYMISKRVGSNMKSDDRRGQEFVYCWKK
jgi:16S rRNA G966 N2-methylase RsmD